MIKYYCDRCKKEITFVNMPTNHYYSIKRKYFSGLIPDKFHLCAICTEKLGDFLEGKEIEKVEK